MSNFGHGKQMRGPYGTNEGDTWLMGDDFQERIKAEKGPGWRMCVSMLPKRDGSGLEEHYYSTDNPEMVAEADEGHERWVAARAAMN